MCAVRECFGDLCTSLLFVVLEIGENPISCVAIVIVSFFIWFICWHRIHVFGEKKCSRIWKFDIKSMLFLGSEIILFRSVPVKSKIESQSFAALDSFGSFTAFNSFGIFAASNSFGTIEF